MCPPVLRWSTVSCVGAVALLSIVIIGELEAQTRVSGSADVAVSSRYVWRGITRRNDWVLQPDAILGMAWPTGSLSLGAWTNFEFSTAEPGSADIGLGERFGEANIWIQLDREFEFFDAPANVSIGSVRYFVDESAAAVVGTTAFNTYEVYLDGRWRLGAMEPRATIWYDFDEVKGFYAELSVAQRVPILPLAVPSLYLKMQYGFSWGQEAGSTDPGERGYFTRDGLTHIDFSAEAQIYMPVGPVTDLYLTPLLHFQVNTDDATRRLSRAPEGEQGSMWWGGLSLSWFW